MSESDSVLGIKARLARLLSTTKTRGPRNLAAVVSQDDVFAIEGDLDAPGQDDPQSDVLHLDAEEEYEQEPPEEQAE